MNWCIHSYRVCLWTRWDLWKGQILSLQSHCLFKPTWPDPPALTPSDFCTLKKMKPTLKRWRLATSKEIPKNLLQAYSSLQMRSLRNAFEKWLGRNMGFLPTQLLGLSPTYCQLLPRFSEGLRINTHFSIYLIIRFLYMRVFFNAYIHF